jgi:nucleotide-binding universal stress UspA family protein
MNTPSPRTVILAAVEPSPASDAVIAKATELAHLLPGAELHVAHVIVVGAPPHEMALSLTDLLAEGRAYLDRIVSSTLTNHSLKLTTHLAFGAAPERILQIAADLSADLIVVGTHEKRGLARLLGSVSQRILTHAGCPVLVAREKTMEVSGPEIEPPCPACVAKQRETAGEQLWCAHHATRHVHGRLHYSVAAGYGEGSMLFHPR